MLATRPHHHHSMVIPWWPVWAVAVALTGTPLVHSILAPGAADVWKHVDIWAPAVNTALLIWLARVQIQAAKNAKQTKEVAREAHKDLVEAVKETTKESTDGEA